MCDEWREFVYFLSLIWRQERRRREEEMMRHREQDDQRRPPEGFKPNYTEGVSETSVHIIVQTHS